MPNPAIESVRFEDDVAREILAGGDIGSLPHDYPLDRMAADRMKELADARERVAKLETALGNLVRFDRGDTAIARGNYQNLMAEACEALGGDWKP